MWAPAILEIHRQQLAILQRLDEESPKLASGAFGFAIFLAGKGGIGHGRLCVGKDAVSF
jgi:hypothetical protein